MFFFFFFWGGGGSLGVIGGSRFMGTSTVNQFLPPLPPLSHFFHNTFIHSIAHFGRTREGIKQSVLSAWLFHQERTH